MNVLEQKDLEDIKKAAKEYLPDMTSFLRAIVKNPGESRTEKEHAETILAEIHRAMLLATWVVVRN